MHGEEALEKRGFAGEQADHPLLQAGPALHGEQKTGHKTGAAHHSMVPTLVPRQISGRNGVSESLGLPEREAQTLSGDRVHKPSCVADQQRIPMNDTTMDPRTGNAGAFPCRSASAAQPIRECRKIAERWIDSKVRIRGQKDDSDLRVA